jgi:hypothetical protein
VFQAEKIGERKITPEGTLQMLLAGMGTYYYFTYIRICVLEYIPTCVHTCLTHSKSSNRLVTAGSICTLS